MKYYLYYKEIMHCGCCVGDEGMDDFDDLEQLNAEYPDYGYKKRIIHGTEIEGKTKDDAD